MRLTEFIGRCKNEIEKIKSLKEINEKEEAYRLFENSIDISFKQGEVTFPRFIYNLDKYSYIELRVKIDEEFLVNTQNLINDSLERMKELGLIRGKSTFDYGISWNGQDFQRATKFPGGLNGNMRVIAHSTTIDPSKKPGSQYTSHEVDAQTRGNVLELKVKGYYRSHLKGILERISPQIATLRLSNVDAGRVRKKRKGLEECLKEEERDVKVSFYPSGQIRFDPNKSTEINIKINDLNYWQELVGIPLLDTTTNQYSQITSLKKFYGPASLFRGNRLKDLKSIVEELERVDLGIVNFGPLITEERAKQILKDELDEHDRIVNHKFFSPSTYNCRRFVGLIAEYCGEDISRRFDRIDNFEDMLIFLKENGYKPKGDIDGGNWTASVRHTLSFIQQCHERDPSLAIEYIKRQYQNGDHGVKVIGDVKDVDAHKLREFAVPKEAILYLIRLNQREKEDGLSNNVLSIELPSMWFDRKSCVTSRININNPIFLPAQEYVLAKLGVTFSNLKEY